MAATGAEADPLPPCPITGEPAAERLESISAKLLADLWRLGARVAPTPLTPGSGRIGLYRSPCGLQFFHPAVPGDGAFYRALYRRFGAACLAAERAGGRQDLRAAAALARPGDAVLDVGCGEGALAALLPAARYQGLDPHAVPRPGGPAILAETAEAHAARHPGAYDLVCGLQVLEHVPDPLGLARAMARCLRPGGLLVLAMPLCPSPLTAFPNNLVNLPPHHLSWWNEGACAALCDALGLERVRIGPVPPSRPAAVLLWAARLWPFGRPGRHVRRGWGVGGAVIAALLLGRLLAAIVGPPRHAAPIDVLLVARRPPAR